MKSVKKLEVSEPGQRGDASAAADHSAEFTRLLQDEHPAGFCAISQIRKGYPATILKGASHYFHVPDVRIRRIASVAATTAATLEKKGANLDAAASERVLRMASVMRMAKSVFGDEEVAKRWMTATNYTFDDSAPIELMDTEPGAAMVRQILNAIATGGAA